MSLRDLIDVAHATLVNEYRSKGAGLHEALLSVDEIFTPDDPAIVQEREADVARRNAQVMASAAALGGRLPTPKRKPKHKPPEAATA